MAPIVLRSTADVIEAIPHFLGFHPTESLVAVLFDGPRLRLTLRVDLLPEPDHRRDWYELAQLITAQASSNQWASPAWCWSPTPTPT